MSAVALAPYESPTLISDSYDENEAAPAIIAAVAAALGVSIAFVTFVCSQCPGQCTSYWRTYWTVARWWTVGC